MVPIMQMFVRLFEMIWCYPTILSAQINDFITWKNMNDNENI